MVGEDDQIDSAKDGTSCLILQVLCYEHDTVLKAPTFDFSSQSLLVARRDQIRMPGTQRNQTDSGKLPTKGIHDGENLHGAFVREQETKRSNERPMTESCRRPYLFWGDRWRSWRSLRH